MATQFRRVHGRIVPINTPNKEGRAEHAAKSAGLVGAGLGVSAVTGTVASHLSRDAALGENIARKAAKAASQFKAAGSHGPLFDAQHRAEYAKLGEAAIKQASHANGLARKSFAIRQGGSVVGAGLIGAGVNKALGKTELKKHPKTKAAVAAGSGFAGVFAVRSAFNYGMGKQGGHRGFEVLKHALKRTIVRGKV